MRVVQIEASPDSDDVSSLDSNTESLNSEDVFAGIAESKAENEQDTQDGMNFFCCIFSIYLIFMKQENALFLLRNYMFYLKCNFI